MLNESSDVWNLSSMGADVLAGDLEVLVDDPILDDFLVPEKMDLESSGTPDTSSAVYAASYSFVPSFQAPTTTNNNNNHVNISSSNSHSGKTSETGTEDSEKDSESTNPKKRERPRTVVELEVVEGVLLVPRSAELECTLEEYEDYMRRVAQHRQKQGKPLTKEEEKELKNQRTRVRNRTYQARKRVKDRIVQSAEKMTLAEMSAQCDELRRANTALREENFRLRSLLAANKIAVPEVLSTGGSDSVFDFGVGSRKRGGIALFALIITFSFFFSPLAGWVGHEPFNTGRSLQSHEGGSRGVLFFLPWVATLRNQAVFVVSQFLPLWGDDGDDLVASSFEGNAALWSLRDRAPNNAVMDASVCLFQNSTHTQLLWALENDTCCKYQSDLHVIPVPKLMIQT